MDSINLSSTTAFYKAVITPDEAGYYKATVNDGGGNSYYFYVIVEDSCLDDIRVKWLGEQGIYKYGTFSEYKTEKHSAKKGLSVDVFNYSLSSAVARSSIVSKTNQRTWTLQKKTVPKEVYQLYLDLAKSPKVYLNVGDYVTDKWIEVSVKWTPSLLTKKDFQNITLDIEFPEDYVQNL